MLDDYILICKMKSGNEDSIEEFINKYYEGIYKYCYRRLNDKYIAEDITQQTFTNFFGNFNNYKNRGKAKNYLYVIAGNLCKNIYISRKTYESIDDVKNEIAYEEEYWQVDNCISIEEALLRLPEEQRDVILLHYFQDLKLREISEILDIKLSLVKYRLGQGIDKLSRIIKKEDFRI